jgi:hypothetical protein
MIRKSWLLSHVNLCKKTISACVAQKLLIKGVIVFIRLGLRIFIQNDRKYIFTRKNCDIILFKKPKVFKMVVFWRPSPDRF